MRQPVLIPIELSGQHTAEQSAVPTAVRLSSAAPVAITSGIKTEHEGRSRSSSTALPVFCAPMMAAFVDRHAASRRLFVEFLRSECRSGGHDQNRRARSG